MPLVYTSPKNCQTRKSPAINRAFSDKIEWDQRLLEISRLTFSITLEAAS